MPDNLVYAGSRHRIRRWRNYGMSMGFGVGIEFLFRDDFLTDETAPLTSPRTAEPGPGIGTFVDTGNNSDIVGSQWVVSGFVADGDPGYWTQALTRATGLANIVSSVLKDQTSFGFDVNQSGNMGDVGFRNSAGAFLRPLTLQLIATIDTITEYQLATILKSSGGFLLVKGGAFIEWTLLWVPNTGNAATVYGGFGIDDAGAGDNLLSYMRVSQLPSPWDTDYGIATDRLAGARAPGDTFVHEADCLIEFEITTLPAIGVTEMDFRIQTPDFDNWRIEIKANGQMSLRELIAGVNNSRASTGVGALIGGERIVVIADDETIRGYYDNTLAWTYALAANFKTETSGEVERIDAGSGVADVISWPRVISGAALEALDRVADA